MIPTVDAFQALARSSPWRWTSLHLRHRSAGLRGRYGDHVEAWLVRPDGVRLVDAAGRSVHLNLDSQRRDGRPTTAWRPPEPAYRPDGLVASRPRHVDDEGLFWENYSWLAMLDPVELSHDVEVSDVRVGERAGRPTWEARLRPLADYAPRCGCCSLLSSAAIDQEQWGDRFAGARYPDHHEVALDVHTGVVVRCVPVGGDLGRTGFENEILEVDA